MPDGSLLVSVSCRLVTNVNSKKNRNRTISVINEKTFSEQSNRESAGRSSSVRFCREQSSAVVKVRLFVKSFRKAKR